MWNDKIDSHSIRTQNIIQKRVILYNIIFFPCTIILQIVVLVFSYLKLF